MLTLVLLVLNLLCAAWNLSYPANTINIVVGAFNAFTAGLLFSQFLADAKRGIY